MTVQITTLSNGMRIVTETLPGYGSAMVGVWTTVGARHEHANQNGMSHFLEHMAFKGTNTRTAKKIAEDIESVGGAINAYTARERTAYYARVLKEDVPTAIDVIGDILRNSLFDEADIETERGVILQEISQSEDTPDDIIFDWAQATAYPNQALGRPILGTPDRVKAFQKVDFQGYIKTHYKPGGMILAAAGAVDHNAIVEQAKGLFGDMDGGATETVSEPAKFNSGQCKRTKDLEQAHYIFSMPSPNRTDPRHYDAVAVSNILGGGMSSRLFQKIREEMGLCYSIFTMVSSSTDCGMFSIYSGTGADELRTLAEVVADQMLELTDTLSQKEIDSTKTQLRASTVMGQESLSNRCERLATEMTLYNRVRPMEEIVEMINGINVDKAKTLASEMFCNTNKVLTTYTPHKTDVPDLAELTARLSG